MKDGLLSIELVREIPVAMRPRKIQVGGSRRGEFVQRPQHDRIEAAGSSPPLNRRVNAKALSCPVLSATNCGTECGTGQTERIEKF